MVKHVTDAKCRKTFKFCQTRKNEQTLLSTGRHWHCCEARKKLANIAKCGKTYKQYQEREYMQSLPSAENKSRTGHKGGKTRGSQVTIDRWTSVRGSGESLWGSFFMQNFLPKSIVLSWILIYRNWSIGFLFASDWSKASQVCCYCLDHVVQCNQLQNFSNVFDNHWKTMQLKCFHAMVLQWSDFLCEVIPFLFVVVSCFYFDSKQFQT